MVGKAEQRETPEGKWLAEAEIEACRQELEASFLREKEVLEFKRAEILERLDQMEKNTLSEVDAERCTSENRRNDILSSLRAELEKRYETFLSQLRAEELVAELAQECVDSLLTCHAQVREGIA